MKRYDPEGRSGQLLADLKEKRLAFIEFQRACAKWLLEPECWKGFYPKDFPEKTEQTIKHETMLPDHRKNLSIKYYEDNPKVLKYLNKRLCVFAANKQRVKDLEEFMDTADNAGDYEKLKAKKKDFEGVIIHQGAELRIKEYLYRQPEIQETVKEFEGELS